MSAQIVQLPERDVAQVPRMLRELADSVERGEFGPAFVCAWVMDCGDGKISTGLCGQSAEPGAVAHYLLALGMRKLESVAS